MSVTVSIFTKFTTDQRHYMEVAMPVGVSIFTKLTTDQ